MARAESLRAFLRSVRSALAGSIAAAVERRPALEPSFVRLGQALARRSRLGGGLYRVAQDSLLARLRASGSHFRAVRAGSVSLQVDISDNTGRYPYFSGTSYEPAVTDAIVSALTAGDAFLDVGANIGYFSTLAARVVGSTGRVIAFEPHEGALTALRAMAQRNGAEAIIEIVAVAIADQPGTLALYTTNGFSAYSTLEPGLSPMRGVVEFQPAAEVRATTLDLWLAGNPDLAGRVRVIKIDVEGAEGRVLAGMRQTLLGPDLTIICETNIGSDADVALERAGFQRHRIEAGTLTYGNFLYKRGSSQRDRLN